jgi:hypothetical protein
MRSSRSFRFTAAHGTIGAAILAFGVAACSSPTTSPSFAPSGGQAAPQKHAVSCQASVVYVVSAYTASIAIYDGVARGAKPCGSITGFQTPQGLFTDSGGNLWVADAGAGKVYEFAPGASTATLTLDDPNGTPNAVAVDEVSHTVYVADYKNDVSPTNVVEIYANGSTTPTGTLGDPDGRNGGSVAVDNQGNVYASFMTQSNKARIDEWTAGGGSPKDLGLRLIGAGSIVTTKTGALAVCDMYAYRCGLYEPGRTRMSHVFGHMGRGRRHDAMSPDKRPWLMPEGLAIDRDERRAYVTSVTLSAWSFPGPRNHPNRKPRAEIKLPGTPAGVGVAVYPASKAGAPYH